MNKPKVNSESQKQLDQTQERFNEFAAQTANFNPLEAISPTLEQEPATKLSKREMNLADAPTIKPVRSVARVNTEKMRTYWDEKFRKMHDRDWEYIKCTAENYEVVGEAIEMWTAEYGCDPAHFWKIPVNKPIYIPRLVARKLKNCKYHRMTMEDRPTNSEGGMQFYGSMVVTHTKQRLDANLVSDNFSAGF